MRAAAALLALLLGGQTRAAEVAVVLGADMSAYAQAFEGVVQGLGAAADKVVLSAGKAELGKDVKVVVALGGEAAQAAYPSSAALVAALVPDPRARLKHGGKVVKVSMLPPAHLLLAKAAALDPQAVTLAVLDPAGAWSGFVAELKAAGGLAVESQNVASLAELPAALKRLPGRAQALWLPPDPLLMNPKAFAVVKEFCLSNKIALLAPVAALARMGALAGLAPSFTEMGRAAGKAAKQLAAGQDPGSQVYAAASELVLNASSAGRIGLALSDAAKRAADTVLP